MYIKKIWHFKEKKTSLYDGFVITIAKHIKVCTDFVRKILKTQKSTV